MNKEEMVGILNFFAWIIVVLHSMIYTNFIPFIISLSMLPYALMLMPNTKNVHLIKPSEDEKQ